MECETQRCVEDCRRFNSEWMQIQPLFFIELRIFFSVAYRLRKYIIE
ncbi:hypothetical protein KKC97_08090 [bacterium]|nr:hypothetical protein [bacterium]MBU1637608.1 hypothetical protein [bacterium]